MPRRSPPRDRSAPRSKHPGTRRTLPSLRPRGARPWLVLGFVALMALLPPVRAVAARAWGVVDASLAASRAAEARERQVAEYARRYGISVELADEIERAAREEELDADLAFRLVRVESAFRESARSPVGALGLTQVMPATANELMPGITREQLLERRTNLRLGFRYLKYLLAVYDGDQEEALTAYNRGMGTVRRIRSAGGDPANGYADLVLGARGGSPVNLVRHDSAPAPAAPLHETAPTRLPSGF